MDIMGKVQDQYGCTDLAASEMNPHCLTVLTLLTAMIITITIIFRSMSTIIVTTTEMLEFTVQVHNN